MSRPRGRDPVVRADADGASERRAVVAVRRCPRGRRDPGRARPRRRRRLARRPGPHGPGRPGRRRPEPRPPGGRRRRAPVDRARDDHQQGLPQRADRDHRRRPHDPARRGLRRGRRRAGVHEPGAAPAARLASRLDLRRHPGRRLPRVRRAHRRVRPRVDGLVDRAREQGALDRARGAGPGRRGEPPARGRGRRSPGCSPPRSSPVEVPQRRGCAGGGRTDEGIRPDTSLESLAVAAPGVLRRRDDHRRQRVAADRRSRGRRRGRPATSPRRTG